MVEDHGLEVIEGHLELVVHAVLVHDLVHLFSGQLVAQLGEGVAQRSRIDPLLLTILGFKLAKKCA